MGKKKTICIDFDGVIHRYSKGWMEGKIYDEPVDGAIEAIKLLQKDFEIVVLTARSSLGEKRNVLIRKWLKSHGLDVKITNIKPPAIAYLDDRAIRFQGNWQDMLNYFI